ncbi:hypothetical protein CANINC_004212 [Pichia inconspicua]|uniref:Uncharacterized protein n=1 Tax=Pichia inconspicua TaxID=52247 RepID=A0A4T0WX01_9ASCO|nr:hypothetical protein CANINC_004212 [[Candida] inconspicua]
MTSLNKTGHNLPHGGILELPNSVMYADMLLENLKKYPNSTCTRCKKDFAQLSTKPFKRCNHCRELQRLRTKRWQTETRQKEGVCSRCRTALIDSNFSLCQKCRVYLRNNKETRLLKGKCVHCSAPNDENDIYKVCKRCRLKDKARRLTLERESVCLKCKTTTPTANGSKRCYNCKSEQISVTKSLRKCIEDGLYDVDNSARSFSNHEKPNQPNRHKRGNEFDGDSKQKQQRVDDDCTKVDYCSAGVSVNVPEYDEQSLEDKILETFTLHHDHAQLNQQLKRLSEYTNGGNDTIDVDVSKYTDEQSVLVDLHGLDDIGITYGIQNVDDIETGTKHLRANEEVENEGEDINNDGCEDSLNLDIEDNDIEDNDIVDNDIDTDDDGDDGDDDGDDGDDGTDGNDGDDGDEDDDDDDDDEDDEDDGDEDSNEDDEANINYNDHGANSNTSGHGHNIGHANNLEAVQQLQQSHQKKENFEFQSGNIGDNATKETMLLHAQAIRETVLSDDAGPSEAEITAAVQAVAAAAAAAVVESNRLNG